MVDETKFSNFTSRFLLTTVISVKFSKISYFCIRSNCIFKFFGLINFQIALDHFTVAKGSSIHRTTPVSMTTSVIACIQWLRKMHEIMFKWPSTRLIWKRAQNAKTISLRFTMDILPTHQSCWPINLLEGAFVVRGGHPSSLLQRAFSPSDSVRMRTQRRMDSQLAGSPSPPRKVLFKPFLSNCSCVWFSLP